MFPQYKQTNKKWGKSCLKANTHPQISQPVIYLFYFELSFYHLQLKSSGLKGSMWGADEYKLPLLPSISHTTYYKYLTII